MGAIRTTFGFLAAGGAALNTLIGISALNRGAAQDEGGFLRKPDGSLDLETAGLVTAPFGAALALWLLKGKGGSFARRGSSQGLSALTSDHLQASEEAMLEAKRWHAQAEHALKKGACRRVKGVNPRAGEKKRMAATGAVDAWGIAETQAIIARRELEHASEPIRNNEEQRKRDITTRRELTVGIRRVMGRIARSKLAIDKACVREKAR